MRELVTGALAEAVGSDDHDYCGGPLIGGHAVAKQPAPQTDASKIYRTTITTNRGTIVMDLDPQLAPNTVNNFVGLARDGYYDGLTFHRVVPEFVIQGGCPEGTGRGGPGLQVRRRAGEGRVHARRGRDGERGPDTNGSQFFICIDDCQRKLTPNYNLFGYVIDGIDVADATQVGDVMQSVQSRSATAERWSPSSSRSLGGVDQAVAAADPALDLAEDERVDDDADDEDHDHHGVHPG